MLVLGGNDTFFPNDLNPTAPIWSTLLNFHAGDAATIWGVTPADFSIAWVAGEGNPAHSGLTMHVTAPGKPAEYLTLEGDLSNGHLAVQYRAASTGAPLPGNQPFIRHIYQQGAMGLQTNRNGGKSS
jgi:hypothetical protein